MSFCSHFSATVFFAVLILFGLSSSSCQKSSGKATGKCLGLVCLHGGSCTGGACACPLGWGGAFCDTPALAGTWNGSEISTHSNPPGSLGNITCTLAVSATDSASIALYNYDNLGGTIDGTLSADKTAITFANRKISLGGGDSLLIINGSIRLVSNDTAEFSFNETDFGLLWANSGKYHRL